MDTVKKVRLAIYKCHLMRYVLFKDGILVFVTVIIANYMMMFVLHTTLCQICVLHANFIHPKDQLENYSLD